MNKKNPFIIKSLLILLLFVCLFLISCTKERLSSENVKNKATGILYYFRYNGKCGFINYSGRVVIQPIFSHASNTFSEGLAVAAVAAVGDAYQYTEEKEIQVDFGDESCSEIRLRGYIDRKGNWVISPRFKHALNFHEGLASVTTDDELHGFIDQKGNWVIKPKFLSAGSFSEGLACILFPDGKYGYIDKSGKTVISPKYSHAGPFRFGSAIASTNFSDKFIEEFLIDKNGNKISSSYSSILRIPDGSYLIKKNGKFGYMDSTGKSIIKPMYDDASSCYFGSVRINGKWGLVDKGNNVIIKPQYDKSISFFWDDWALVKKDGKKFFIDHKENIMLIPEFKDFSGFEDGLAQVYFKAGNGYMDKSGKLIFDLNSIEKR